MILPSTMQLICFWPTLDSGINGGGRLLIFGKITTQDIFIPTPPFINLLEIHTHFYKILHISFNLTHKIGKFPPRTFLFQPLRLLILVRMSTPPFIPRPPVYSGVESTHVFYMHIQTGTEALERNLAL